MRDRGHNLHKMRDEKWGKGSNGGIVCDVCVEARTSRNAALSRLLRDLPCALKSA